MDICICIAGFDPVLDDYMGYIKELLTEAKANRLWIVINIAKNANVDKTAIVEGPKVEIII